MSVLETAQRHLLKAMVAFLLICEPTGANPDAEVARLENSLVGLVGEDRFEVLYPWLEQHREVKPQAALKFGQEAIDLLTDGVDARQSFYVHYWTAEAAWYLGDLDLASSLVTRAHEIARDLDDQELEYFALLVLASADRRRGAPLDAVKHSLRMREIALNPSDEVRALNSLAMTYREMEDLTAALDTYLEALQIYLKLPRDEFMGTLLANTGRVYFLMGQTKEAIQNTEEALVVSREFGRERDAAYVLYNLGSYRLEAEEYEEAQEHLEEALEILVGLGEEGHVPIYIQSDLAIALAAQGRGEEALERSEKALQQAREKENSAWLLKAHLAYAHVQQRLGRLRLAQEQLELAIPLAESLDRQFQLAESLKQLASVHEELGELDSALAYLQQSTELQNRLVDEKHQRHFAEWRARLSFTEAEQQLVDAENAKKLQEAELNRQRAQRNSLFSSTILLILLCMGVIFSHLRLRRTLLALEEAHSLLEVKREKLEQAFSQVNLLSGLLPICAECKSIRDDDGYWQMIENYITEHSEAEFSHGICPDCFQRLYPEFRACVEDH